MKRKNHEKKNNKHSCTYPIRNLGDFICQRYVNEVIMINKLRVIKWKILRLLASYHQRKSIKYRKIEQQYEMDKLIK